jgi:hypothetical protein
MQWLLIEAGHAPTVTPVQVHIYTILNWVLLGLDGLLGVLIFIRRWRRAATRTEPGPAVHEIDATEHGQRDTDIAPHPPANSAELAASK